MSAHAASRRQRPPAPPLQLTLPPPARRRSRVLGALLYALGLLVLGGVVAAGWVLGSTVAHRKAAPAATWRPVALGSATLAVPAQWQPEAASVPGVHGLPAPAVTFTTVPGLQAYAVLAIAPAGRSPSADVALARLIGPLGTPRPSQVAGRPAQTYAPRPVAGGRTAQATLAPTAGGTLIVLCIARSASWTGAAGCAGDLKPR